jgi:hypothetical protein
MRNSLEQRGLEALKKWCDDKPMLLCWFATQVAVSMEATFELIRLCRGDIGLFTSGWNTRRSEWLGFYTRHRCWRRGLLIGVGANSDEADACEGVVDSLSWMSRSDKAYVMASMQDVTPAEWQESWANGVATRKALWEDHWSDLNGTSDDGMSEAEAGQFFGMSAVQFFFRVAFPCWVLHGKWPSRMLWMASRGGPAGLRALKDLIRLDNQVIHHPRLDNVLHPPQRALRQSRKSWLTRALNGKTAAISRVRLKYRLGRLIYDVAQRIGSPLTTPAISELFNISATLRVAGVRATAPVIYPASFLRGIERESGHWDLPNTNPTSISQMLSALR